MADKKGEEITTKERNMKETAKTERSKKNVKIYTLKIQWVFRRF